MATITQKTYSDVHFGSAPPYGNFSVRHLRLETNSVGAVANSDVATGVAIGDVVRVGVIPGGMKLIDFLMIISDATTAALTGKIGFQYVDGVDDTAVPQDDDYFVAAGQSLATAAVVRKTAATKVVTLPKDAYLIVTTAGAASDAVALIDFAITGEIIGPL